MAKFLKFLKVFTVIAGAVVVTVELAGSLARNARDIKQCIEEKKKLKAELKNS